MSNYIENKKLHCINIEKLGCVLKHSRAIVTVLIEIRLSLQIYHFQWVL